MQRRKFLIGLGSLTAGAAVATGTGAFTTARQADRPVTVGVQTDPNAQIALIPGDYPDIQLSNGELELDLTGGDGEGVNIDSVYTWGDPSYSYGDSAAADNYAFAIQNNDEQAYNTLTMSYELANDGWFSGEAYPQTSVITFSGFTETTPAGSMQVPANNGDTSASVNLRDEGSPNPPSHNQFTPGEQLYVVVQIDTTGVDAAPGQDLTGTLTIEVSDPA